MADSFVAIANSALAKIGGDRIISLDDDTREGRLMKEQLPKIFVKLLYSHPWKFAIKRTELAALTTAPAFGYNTQYQLPLDCLRVLETDSGNEGVDWQREGNVIVSDDSSMFVKYISSDVQPGQFSAGFSEVLAVALAYDVCYSFNQSSTLRAALEEDYKAQLREARSFNGQEGGTRQVYAKQWLNARN